MKFAEEFIARSRCDTDTTRSMKGEIEYETDRAKSLKSAYQDKLARRKEELKDLARRTGWLYLHHSTSTPPRSAMLWLFAALEGFRR